MKRIKSSSLRSTFTSTRQNFQNRLKQLSNNPQQTELLGKIYYEVCKIYSGSQSDLLYQLFCIQLLMKLVYPQKMFPINKKILNRFQELNNQFPQIHQTNIKILQAKCIQSLLLNKCILLQRRYKSFIGHISCWMAIRKISSVRHIIQANTVFIYSILGTIIQCLNEKDYTQAEEYCRQLKEYFFDLARQKRNERNSIEMGINSDTNLQWLLHINQLHKLLTKIIARNTNKKRSTLLIRQEDKFLVNCKIENYYKITKQYFNVIQSLESTQYLVSFAIEKLMGLFQNFPTSLVWQFLSQFQSKQNKNKSYSLRKNHPQFRNNHVSVGKKTNKKPQNSIGLVANNILVTKRPSTIKLNIIPKASNNLLKLDWKNNSSQFHAFKDKCFDQNWYTNNLMSKRPNSYKYQKQVKTIQNGQMNTLEQIHSDDETIEEYKQSTNSQIGSRFSAGTSNSSSKNYSDGKLLARRCSTFSLQKFKIKQQKKQVISPALLLFVMPQLKKKPEICSFVKYILGFRAALNYQNLRKLFKKSLKPYYNFLLELDIGKWLNFRDLPAKIIKRIVFKDIFTFFFMNYAKYWSIEVNPNQVKQLDQFIQLVRKQYFKKKFVISVNLGQILSQYSIEANYQQIQKSVNKPITISQLGLSQPSHRISIFASHPFTYKHHIKKTINDIQQLLLEENEQETIILTPNNKEQFLEDTTRSLFALVDARNKKIVPFINYFNSSFICRQSNIKKQFAKIFKSGRNFVNVSIKQVDIRQQNKTKPKQLLLVRSINVYRNSEIKLIVNLNSRTDLLNQFITNHLSEFKKKLLNNSKNSTWQDVLFHKNLHQFSKYSLCRKIINEKQQCQFILIKLFLLSSTSKVLILLQRSSQMYFTIISFEQFEKFRRTRKSKCINQSNKRTGLVINTITSLATVEEFYNNENLKSLQDQRAGIFNKKILNTVREMKIHIRNPQNYLEINYSKYQLNKICYYWFSAVSGNTRFFLRAQSQITILSLVNELLLLRIIPLSSFYKDKQASYQETIKIIKQNAKIYKLFLPTLGIAIDFRIENNEAMIIIRNRSCLKKIEFPKSAINSLNFENFAWSSNWMKNPKIRKRVVAAVEIEVAKLRNLDNETTKISAYKQKQQIVQTKVRFLNLPQLF